MKYLDARSKKNSRFTKHSTTVNQLSRILVQRLAHFHPSLDNLYILGKNYIRNWGELKT